MLSHQTKNASSVNLSADDETRTNSGWRQDADAGDDDARHSFADGFLHERRVGKAQHSNQAKRTNVDD